MLFSLQRELFFGCTEWGWGGWGGWGLGLGLTDRFNPRSCFLQHPAAAARQHRGPWGRNQPTDVPGKAAPYTCEISS